MNYRELILDTNVMFQMLSCLQAVGANVMEEREDDLCRFVEKLIKIWALQASS